MFEFIGNLAKAGVDLFGGIKNRQMQNTAMKKGIQLKVADALKAGVHPNVALGAQTFSPSPVSFGGDSLAAAGQSLDRATDTGRSSSAKDAAFIEKTRQLQIQNMELKNAALASNLATRRQAGGTTPMPSPGQRFLLPGQSGSGAIEDKPLERQTVDPQNPHQEAGAVADVGFTKTPTGYAPVPSKDFKDRGEDMLGPEIGWNLRNWILPNFQINKTPPFKAPPDKYWVFNPFRQQYELEDRKRGRTNRGPGKWANPSIAPGKWR